MAALFSEAAQTSCLCSPREASATDSWRHTVCRSIHNTSIDQRPWKLDSKIVREYPMPHSLVIGNTDCSWRLGEPIVSGMQRSLPPLAQGIIGISIVVIPLWCFMSFHGCAQDAGDH